MDESMVRNYAVLRGILADAPRFSHMSRGERFFIFPVETRRLSGTADTINVIARQSLLESAEIMEAGKIRVTGELRSFNNKRGEGAKLVITVFAKALALEDGEDINAVELSGTLCKEPNLRVTPMGAQHLRPYARGEPPLRQERLPALHLLGQPCEGGRGHAHGRPPVAHRTHPEPPLHKAHRRRAGGKGRLRGVHRQPERGRIQHIKESPAAEAAGDFQVFKKPRR